jgi:transcriptional regulator with XRE-family HTH domain
MMLSRSWLTQLRLKKFELQKHLAEAIGVSAALICQWEAGARRPSYDKMCLLAKVLGAEVHQHFADEAEARQSGQVA